MAVIHTDKKHFNVLTPLLVALAMAAVLGVWWYLQSNSQTAVPEVAPPSAFTSTPTIAFSNNTPASQEPTSPQTVSQMELAQQESAKGIEQEPRIEPIKGTVSERPTFMSEMEWNILKAVAQQQPDPDKALTALTNKVRFTKQLEVWQDLSATADPAKRKVLANELLEDLPQRVTNEDMDLLGAQKLQGELLLDAEPDVTARTKRAAKEAKRLEKAVPPKATQG